MEKRTHLIADESLGGLLREYTETDRSAEADDHVVIVDKRVAFDYENGDIFVIYRADDDRARFIDNAGDFNTLYHSEYKTLSPTDIVHVDGERFRMVDRKAEIGEKVVVIAKGSGWYDDKIGEVFTVISGLPLGFDNTPDHDAVYVDESDNHVNRIAFVSDGKYRVLEPVEPEAEALTEVTTAEASPSVIEMLANLSQRIVALEAENKRQNDEIDTLHRNNVRLGEELERYRAEAKAPATTEVDAVDFSGFIDAVAAKVADRIAKGLSA